MIPNTKDRSLSSSGVVSSGSFGISLEDSSHIMTILRDTLYSDKVMAVLREYSANAWDAHRQVGKIDVPITVHLPTADDPVLRISDEGPGLSKDEIFSVFSQYGMSTKRTSDAAVGMLGIGSKSGFAYSDSFTIISKNGGVCATYVAVLDQSDRGIINQLAEEPCNSETGLTIEIPVKIVDLGEFHQKAKRLFVFFEPKPKCNLPLPSLSKQTFTEVPDGMFGEPLEDSEYHNGVDGMYGDNQNWHCKSGSWFAKMGCIAYKINLDEVAHFGNGIPHFFNNACGILNFNIGELQISASREGLKYGDSTKEALSKKFNSVIDGFIQKLLEEVDGYSNWEKKVRYLRLSKMGIPIPAKWESIIKYRIKIDPKPVKFTIGSPSSTHNKVHETTRIDIGSPNRIIMRDTLKNIKGYSLTSYDYFVEPKEDDKGVKYPWNEVVDELRELLKNLSIDGIPCVLLSELPWVKPTVFYNPKKRNSNSKYNGTIFQLKDVKLSSLPHSSNWEKTKEIPKENEPFVILKDFKAWDLENFTKKMMIVRWLFNVASKELPTIFGFKKTSKNKISYQTVKFGKPFDAWFKETVENLKKDHLVVKYFELQSWVSSGEFDKRYTSHDEEELRRKFTALLKPGKVKALLEEYEQKCQEFEKLGLEGERSYDRFVALRDLGYLSDIPSASDRIAELRKIYPLLKTINFNSLWDRYYGKEENQRSWAHYFELIDERMRISHESSSLHNDQRIDNSDLEGQITYGEEGRS